MVVGQTGLGAGAESGGREMSDFPGLSPGRGRSSHYGGSPPVASGTRPMSNFTRPNPSHGRSSHYGGSPPQESGGTRPTAQRGTSTGALTGDGQ